MPNEATATGHDAPRPAATGRDNTDFTLSIEEVSERYARAGHPRTIRTLQRYCVSGHLDAQKVATTLGDKYLITPQSVARHIAQIEELRALDTVATDRDQPRPVATPIEKQEPPQSAEAAAATPDDKQRQTATTNNDMSPYVAQLETRIKEKDEVIGMLRGELVNRNEEIVRRNERERETNILIRGLQNLVLRLQPGKASSADVLDGDTALQNREPNTAGAA